MPKTILLLVTLWISTVQAQSLTSHAQQHRLDNLYQTFERDLLPLPLPEVPPCTFSRLQENRGDPPDTKKWLAEVALLRENGSTTCAFQLLQALKQPATARETDQIRWLYELTLTLTRTEQLDSAIATARQLTALAERSSQFQGQAWLTEAEALHGKRRLSETYRLAEQSLAFARRYGDRSLEIKALDVISDVSRDIYMTRPEKSVPPLLEAISIARTLRDTDFVVRGLVALSLHHMDTDWGKSLDFMEQAAHFPQAGRSPRSHHSLLRTLGYFFQFSQELERSNRLLERSAAIGKRLGLRSSVQNDYEQISSNYMAINDVVRAQACLDSAYLYCNFQRELGYFYRSFAEVAAMRGDMPKAFEWYQKAFEEQIKGYSNRNTQQLTEQETRFRTREHELQVDEQKRLRWLWVWLALALAGLFVGAAYAFFHQRKIRKKLSAQNALIEHQSAELRRLDEAKSRFFANVSHEFRTPLTLILGPLGSMLKSIHLNGQDTALARTAQQHAQQLLRVVNEILDLSKMESGKMKLQETTVSLQPFLRRVASAFESHAERLGIQFVFDYQVADRLRVLVDEDKLQKVVNNLLSNALKFTPAHSGGTVTVRVEEADNRIRLGVQDTGRGIHADDLPHVFERFYQTAQADAPVEGGTGIGLALCREFAEVMGGRIWAESRWGGGSQFYFEFPKKEVLGAGGVRSEELAVSRGQEAGNGEQLRMANDVMANDESRPTILLVEDNDSLRDYVRLVLSEKYHIKTAEHGQAALDLLAAQPLNHSTPQLIISDVMMPVMDGFQLVEKLKGDDRYRHIPVVMLTARADLRDKLKALRIGVDDYLLKPFEEEELLARVENLLKNHQGRVMSYELEVMDDSAETDITHHSKLITPDDMAWLADLEKTVEQSLGGPNLIADALADAMLTSRTKFFQQVKRLTGMTPNEYVLEVRFTKARMLLETRSATSVKAAAGAVGFRDVEYFSKQFRARFGKVPSEYLG